MTNTNNQTEIGSVFRLNQISTPEENPEDFQESGWVWWIIGGIFIIMIIVFIVTMVVKRKQEQCVKWFNNIISLNVVDRNRQE